MGGRNGFALNSDVVGVGIVLTLEWSLGELMLKLWRVGVRVGVPAGVPVRLGGSDCPASIGLIIFDSMSVESYETNVESWVGNESDALRLPLNRCLVSVLSRRTVYGFSFLGSVSSISGDVGIFVRSVTSL